LNNEPAFPTKINTEHFSHPSTIYNTGMTLRDYFAAKTLQGLLSNRNAEAAIDEFASKSYQMADAMLKARQA
jgi:hypothetical protein